jgi:surface protein
MPGFVFTCLTSQYTNAVNSGKSVCPIVNTNNSFTGLARTVVSGNGTTTITWTWTTFTDNGTTNDGLRTSAIDIMIYNPNINIIAFGQVPLSRGGGQFVYFQGKNTSTDAPTILTNTSFQDMFYYGGPQGPFGNMGSWDTTNVINMSNTFYYYNQFSNDLSSWNVSNVTTMANMFNGCYLFNSNLSSWNVSNVTDMSTMFYATQTASASASIGSWDVSKVTYMNMMFTECSNFNCDITSWNVSNVIDMNAMFSACYAFNQDLSGWNVSNVTNISRLFENCSDFNQDLSSWNVLAVTNMSKVFKNCGLFNANLSSWNVSNVTSMSGMFNGCTSFNQDISGWNVSNVTDMADMFTRCSLFNQDLINWEVSNVIDMRAMFAGCSQFNSDLSSWNVSVVTQMFSMFAGCTIFNQDISGWDVSQVQGMSDMFNGCSHFNQNLSGWTVGQASNMSKMFQDCYLFNCLTIGLWNFTNVGDITNIITNTGFSITQYGQFLINLSNNTTIPNNLNLGIGYIRYNTTAVNNAYANLTNSGGKNMTIIDAVIPDASTPKLLFTVSTNNYNSNSAYICPINNEGGSFSNLTSTVTNNGTGTTTIAWNWTAFNDSGANDGYQAANYNIFRLYSITILNWGSVPLSRNSAGGLQNGNIVVSALDSPIILSNTNLSNFFTANVPNISGWDVSNVINMSFMFYGCTSFNQDISSWNVSNVTDMRYMFLNCTSFNQPLNSWNVSNVTDMGHMFLQCNSFNQPLNSWNVSNVTNMGNMFNSTQFNQPLNSWNVTNVTDMGGMFANCAMFDQDIRSWNVSAVTGMNYMFANCTSFNQPLSSWNVSSVTNMDSMFANCILFDQNISGWNVSSVTNMGDMFNNCFSFNDPLNSWNVSSVTNMGRMFAKCPQFNQPLNLWNVSNVNNMAYMFQGAEYGRTSNFNQDISSWNVSNVTDMGGMFYQATSFNQPIGPWNVSAVTNMGQMFNGCLSFNQVGIGLWNFTSVNPNNLYGFIINTGYNPLQYDQLLINLSTNAYLPNNAQFGPDGLTRYNNSSSNAAYIYLTTPVASGGKGSNITDTVMNEPLILYRPFVFICATLAYIRAGSNNCPIVNTDNSFTGLTRLSVNNGNGTTTVTWKWTSFMDNGTTNDGLKISGNSQFVLNVASLNITAFGSVPLSRNSTSGFENFSGQITATDRPDILPNTNCTSLFANSTVPSINFGNIGGWSVSNVINMNNMFNGCTNFNQNISGWTVSNVSNMAGMFNGCANFNQHINNWNVSNVSNMASMLNGCTNFNQDISIWNVANVTNISKILINCTSFNKPAIGKWIFTNVTDMTNMIYGCGFSSVQYQQFLVYLSRNIYLPNNLSLGSTRQPWYNNNVQSSAAYIYLTKSVIGGGKNMTITYTVIVTPLAISSNACFPANTPIQTNQGTIMIDQINPEIHTIRNKKIVALVQTISQDKQLVCIKKHALGNNVPSEQINISNNHQILYKGKMVKAKELVGKIEDITLVKYTGEILYNILMDEHDKMIINNLIVETMHPEHRLAKLYNVFHIDKMPIDQQMIVIAELNKIVSVEPNINC